MRLKITHTTHYRFDAPVTYGLQQLRLTPKSRDGHRVLSWETKVEGGIKQFTYEDEHANIVDLVSIGGDHVDVTITSAGEIETEDRSGVVGNHHGFMPLSLFLKSTPLTRAGQSIRALARESDDSDPIARLHSLMHTIAEAVSYEIGKTDPETSAEDAAAAGYGVCQDHAHIMIACARYLKFPARYVSGYLMMNDRIEQEASHAWAEVHVEGVGWIGFDPSNRICPDARYVRVATGMDYNEAMPICGMRFGEASEDMLVTLQVQQ